MTDHPVWTSRFVSAQDGLSLHVREICASNFALPPVICLPGLTRHSEDFEVIGQHIAAADGRRVLALDYRGRGRSDFDPKWQNYNLMIELRDLMTVLDDAAIKQAIFLGTSRGGLITMLLAQARPSAILGAALNDIGPVIEVEGLKRIAGYVGKIASPTTHQEGATILKAMFGEQFPDEDDASWLRFSHRSWRELDGKLVGRADKNLMQPLKDVNFEVALPTMWPVFDLLSVAPLMVIRGGLSDLLSENVAREMVSRHPDAQLHTVARQGHAPLLEDAPTIAAVLEFIVHSTRVANGEIASSKRSLKARAALWFKRMAIKIGMRFMK